MAEFFLSHYTKRLFWLRAWARGNVQPCVMQEDGWRA